MWGVTVVDTLAQSYVAATSQQAGAAADAAETRKQRKYEALANRFIVQPIGLETMGTWGAGAKAFLTEVSSRVKQVTGNARAMEFLRQRVGTEIQRGNATAVMGTVDSTKEWNNLLQKPGCLHSPCRLLAIFSTIPHSESLLDFD